MTFLEAALDDLGWWLGRRPTSGRLCVLDAVHPNRSLTEQMFQK